MSEHFEKQVKHTLEEVQLEPRAEVWQHVRQAIQPEKHRRRFIFWWILPAVLLAGGIFYMMRGEVMTKPTAQSGQFAEKPAVPLPGKDDHVEKSPDGTTANILHGEPDNTIQKDNTDPVQVSVNIKNDLPSKRPGAIKTGRSVEPANNVTTPVRETGRGPGLVSNPVSSMPPAIQKDTVTNSMEDKKKLVATKPAPAKSPDTTVITPAPVTPTAKQPEWRWGIAVDAGVSSLADGFGMGKKSDVLFLNNFSSSGPFSGISSTGYRHTTSGSRMSGGISFTGHKEISKAFSFEPALGYRRQSFSLTTVSYKDSLIAVMVSPYLFYRSTAEYTLHFINLYAGFSLRIAEVEAMRLSLGAGIDNQFLVAGKQFQREQSFLGAPYILEASNNSLSAYQRWQPQLDLRLNAGFSPGNKQWWQLSPYLRYGLRPFAKQGTGSKDHPVSAGITATFFFR